MNTKRVSLQVPATSANLGPGFDVLGIALHLYNEVTLEADPKGWTGHRTNPSLIIQIDGEGRESLPRDGTNLVLRAAMKVFEKARRWPQSVKIRLVNRIPLSRGMGSSAAATVGGICAANALLGKPFKDDILLDLAVAMEGHPDNVVPAFAGGFCVCGVIQGQTRYLKFPAPASLQAVVCSPERPLATLEARRVLPSRIPFTAAVFTSSRVAFLISAILQKQYDLLGFAMEDILHQPFRAKLIPGLNDVILAARKTGAYGSALSGAGSSVIAFCSPGGTAQRVGQAMQKAFTAHKVPSRWSVLAFDSRGLRSK